MKIQSLTAPSHPKPSRLRRLRRQLLALLVLLATFAIWINGPGLRWLGPIAARKFLSRTGITGDLRIEGSLSHGFSISGVTLTSKGPLARLTLDRLTPSYRWSQLIHGKLDGITLDGLAVTMRLDAPPGTSKPVTEPAKPLDLTELAATLSKSREQFLPIALDLTRIRVTALKSEQPVVTLAPSDIRHRSGQDEIDLTLGAITDSTGRIWPAQSTRLAWRPDRFTVDRLEPHPVLGLHNLVLHLPAGKPPSLETRLRIDEATLALTTTPGFAAAAIRLESGTLQLDRAARDLGLEVPTTATLTTLSVHAANLLPDPLAATATLEAGLENITYQEWQIPRFNLSSVVEPNRATLTLNASSLGTELALDSELALTRSGGAIHPGLARGTFRIPAIPTLVRQLAEKFPAIKNAAATPDSALAGSFTADLTENQLQRATLDTTLSPIDPATATPLAVTAVFQPDQPLAACITLDGLKFAATFDPAAKSYQGTLDLADFTTARLERWLAVPGVTLPGAATLTATWSGRGDLTTLTHTGTLDLTTANWQPAPDPANPTTSPPPPITATTRLDYTWPGTVRLASLEAKTRNQTIQLAAALADRQLTLSRLLWRDGDTEIAQGTATLPVPADLTKWRDALATDNRPIHGDIHTRVLDLALLKPWLPPTVKLDPTATAQLKLKLAGSYSKPAFDLTADCLNLRSPDQPKLPPADLKLTAKTTGDILSVHTTVTPKDYPPAVLTASMPFRPAAWAADPDAVKKENLTARLDLPRLDLSRFTSLVPALRKLGGTVSGNVTAGGPLSKPDARGVIRLENAAITLADPNTPPIESLGAEVNFSPGAVTLTNLRATLAGGSLTGGGTLTLKDQQPSTLDFRIRGEQLPLLRNDMLILRSNADLRLAGPWQSAALTGTVAVVDSLFYRDIELLPIGKPFTTPSAASLPKLDARAASGKTTAAVPAPFNAWTLNLAIRTQDPFLIRGNIATGRVDVNLRAIGTLADPKLDGTVTLADLTAALPFSTLRVKRGTVRFTPATGFDPVLEIRGNAEPRPYRIEAFVFGKASDPQIMLTSSPPLPESEIMTLLATGTTTAGLEDTGAATNRAIQLFAEEVRRGRVRYTKQLRPLLGLLDRVDFSLKESDPYSTGSLSTATISLTDRWFVSAGMGEQGNTRVMGIWRFSFK